VRFIVKTVICSALFLSIFLTACNSVASTPSVSKTPTINPTDIMSTAVSIAKTEIVMTQVAIPIATLIPPTITPPGDYSNNFAPPPGKLDYAKKTLRIHHALLPYINDVKEIYGLEYYGCVETDIFGGSIGYDIMLPIETVNKAFIKFYKENGWEFVEPIQGSDMDLPSIKYEVYRISTIDKSAFEKLEVILYDFTAYSLSGKSHTRVKSNLIHIEDRKYFSYVFDFGSCKQWFAFNTGW